MDLKWLEDLQALAQAGSFSRAAALRHVTHPAFGRRIRALEEWAGAALVERAARPVQLTPAGSRLAAQGGQALRSLLELRDELRGDPQAQGITLATGRTLARTLVADWMAALAPRIGTAVVTVRTAGIAETLHWLEQGEADLLIAYHHASIAQRPQGRNFVQKTLAHDKLVPVVRRTLHAATQGRSRVAEPVPYLAYAPSLALAGLVADHLNRSARPPQLRRVAQVDSADALLEYALKGLGACWLPWSLAAQACRQGRLVPAWGRTMEIPFEVRLVRMRRRLGPLAEALWEATPEV